MPSELGPILTAVAAIIAAIGTYIWAPTIKGRIEARARRENHDQAGWEIAVASLEGQIVGLRDEVQGLRKRVVDTEKQLSERDQRISDLESMVAEQSRSLARADARVRQLEQAWPPTISLPLPDPGFGRRDGR